MNKQINTTIEKLKGSIIQLSRDIDTKNPAGITTFVTEFVPLLNRLSDFMLIPEFAENEYYQKLKADISNIFDQLFTEGQIFEIAHELVNDDGVTEATIIAMKRNGNPLSKGAGALKRSVGQDHFRAFVSEYRGLFENDNTLSETEKAHLTLIYNRYQSNIDEPLHVWLSRFAYPNGPDVKAMTLEKEAREGTRRLAILAILYAINDAAGNKFDFAAFALERFGIRGFRKAISTHKDKQEFNAIVTECNKILKA